MAITLANGRKRPVVGVAVGIDGCPIDQTAFHIVVFEVEGVTVVTSVIKWSVEDNVTRGGDVILNTLLGFCSKRSFDGQIYRYYKRGLGYCYGCECIFTCNGFKICRTYYE